ncbi:MAG TPA: hypothetical protein VIJ14_02355 [Rhabdochlamydiaceae bacterium]
MEYIAPSPSAPSLIPLKRLIATPHSPTSGPTKTEGLILAQLDIYSTPTHSLVVDLAGGEKVEVSEAFLFDLNRAGEDQWLFLQGTLVEPAQIQPEKVVADLYDLVGREKVLLRTLTEVCNQRAWIDLRHFIQDQYYRERGEYPIISSHKRQSLSIYKDAEGTITVNSCLAGDIIYECRQGKTFKLEARVDYTAACEYDLTTQTILYQHTFT